MIKTWAPRSKVPNNPQPLLQSELLAEIERIRGNAPGVSRQYILEHAGLPGYPEITALEQLGLMNARKKIARTLNTAGWKRRTANSTYWLVPE